MTRDSGHKDSHWRNALEYLLILGLIGSVALLLIQGCSGRRQDVVDMDEQYRIWQRERVSGAFYKESLPLDPEWSGEEER